MSTVIHETTEPVATTNPQVVVVQAAPPRELPEGGRVPQVKIVSHSRLFYWWPTWVVGYTMAALTHLYGHAIPVGDGRAIVHQSNNLGVIFLVTLFLVMLITNVTVRGLMSVIVLLSLALATVLMAYYHVWDSFLAWLGNLTIYLNLGAYFWFSTCMLGMWLLSTFIFDRLTYWRVKPGQLTQEFVFGTGSTSFDTDNMVLEKLRDDVFRHWLLGFGSGDLKVRPYGAQQDPILIPNVLFLNSKVGLIERLLATEPGSLRQTAP